MVKKRKYYNRYVNKRNQFFGSKESTFMHSGGIVVKL